MLRIKSELFGTIELPIDKIDGGDAWYGLSQFLDVNVFVDYEERQVRASIYPVWTDKGTVNTNYEIEGINILSDEDVTANDEGAITYDFDPFYCPNMTDQEKCVEFFANNGVRARVFREEDVVVQVEHLEVQVDKEEVKLRAKLYDSTIDDRHKSESDWCVRIYDPSKCDKKK
jgi:hypothetical protein